MNDSRTNRARVVRAGALAGAIALALAMGCGRNRIVEPLPTTHATGAAVAGTVRLQDGSPGAGIAVTLDPIQGGLSATVRRAGKPIPLASARRSAPAIESTGGTPSSAPYGIDAVRATVTDAAGRFVFGEVEKGEYLVTGVARHYQSGVGRVTVEATETETTFVDLHLMPTGTFSGSGVLEGESQHAGIVVYVNGTSFVAVTDPTGQYVMTDVPVGTQRITAMHPGFRDSSVTAVLSFAGDSVNLKPLLLRVDRNIRPSASASVTGGCGVVPVTLSGSGSDPDGSIVRYDWDFEDDGIIDYSSISSGNTTHTYGPGPHRAKLTVRDNKGAFGFAVVTFNIDPQDTLYVSAAAPSGGNGSKANPFKTLAAGLAAGAASPSVCPAVVIVSNDTYAETPTFPNEVVVRGGYDASTWTHTAGSYTVVNVGTSPAVFSSVSNDTISGLDFRADNQSTANSSSIAVRCAGSTAGLVFIDCRFASAAAGPSSINGGNGTSGSNGSPGGPGGAGTSGGSGGGVSGLGGVSGVSGGPSGTNGGPGGYNGANGVSGGNSLNCGSGGTAGTGSSACGVVAGNGGIGAGPCPTGTSGAGGVGGSVGSGSASGWTLGVGNIGLTGNTGWGGAGGGGGGGGTGAFPCNADRGGGGGGGGGSGGWGTGGGGGGAGGASFAVLLHASSPVFNSCSFTSGSGGVGGSGGNGGPGGLGGAGGPGGPGADDGGAGGAGGAGGNGGAGGGGAGGPGGPSVCIARSGGSNPTIASPTYTVGTPGTGGSGGTGPVGNNGSAGATGPSGTVMIF